MQITANGIEINCELSGASDRPIVAMSHSLGSSLVMWNPQLDLLERHYRVLRIDTRGHGATSAPPGPYSMEMLVDDAVYLLDALEIDQVHWVGLSMGGMIGQGLAFRAPQRLSSLSLCDTMAVVRQEAKETWKQRINSGEKLGIDSLVDFAMERWFTEPYRKPDNQNYQTIRNQFLATSITGYLGCCHAIFDLNYIDQLSSIDTPTHIIVGDQDLATPVSESFEMQKRIAGSTIEIIPGAAHLSNVEKAEQFNASLLKFLQSG